jgi:hypothetical protein
MDLCQNGGTPIAGWFIMENPFKHILKWMIWEYSYFRKPPYQTSKMIKHEIVLTFYLGIFVFGIEVST